MRIPNRVLSANCRRHVLHIQIAAHKERPLDPTQSTTSYISDLEVLTDIREAIGVIVRGCVERDCVPAARKGLSEADALTFAAAFDQKLMND